MNSAEEISDLVDEVKKKFILHWNYRGLTEIPEQIRGSVGHLEEIYLKYNNLSTLPTWILDFTNVTNLYLYANNIDRIPSEIQYMKKLTILDLSVNRLTQIPTCLGNLDRLQSLMLSENQISYLPHGKLNFLA